MHSATGIVGTAATRQTPPTQPQTPAQFEVGHSPSLVQRVAAMQPPAAGAQISGLVPDPLGQSASEGTYLQPWSASLQESLVHSMPSSQASGSPATQNPSTQRSTPSHTEPSEHWASVVQPTMAPSTVPASEVLASEVLASEVPPPESAWPASVAGSGGAVSMTCPQPMAKRAKPRIVLSGECRVPMFMPSLRYLHKMQHPGCRC